MEMEQRKQPRKTNKKGGTRGKALTAEDEARRREEVKEQLRQRLELEKRAQKVVERLLDDSVAEDFLVDCAKFITQANYKDAVEERSIVKLCGYPICPNKLCKIPTQQFKISTKTNKVYDITERKCFCSNFCFKASKEFELQISKTALWIRQHERPPQIKLMKKGDGGSSGEEVILTERRLQAEDVENPPAAQCVVSQEHGAEDNHCDEELEQDFVSSIVSQRPGRRVHWGDLPKRTDEDKKGGLVNVQRREKHNEEEEAEKENEHRPSQKVQKKGKTRQEEEGTKKSEDGENPRVINTDQTLANDKDVSNEPNVEEVTAKINLCSLSNAHSKTDSNSPTENTLSSTPTITHHNTTEPAQPGLAITQVGMSKKGAAGLRDLLKNHTAAPAPIRLHLLEGLRRTLGEWSTDKTFKFLYGAEHALCSAFADVKEEDDDDDEEELDEDDFEDEVIIDDGALIKPSAADCKTQRGETQQLDPRFKEFYGEEWTEELETQNDKVAVKNKGVKDPTPPLVDSQAQHLIQTQITMEKLTNCLKNIVGPLHLTMSDISADLNCLVKTFRFTNTNIIHKTPEWTLIAVVLLHLLSDVSAVVREALEMKASVDYLNTTMEALGLQEQDVLNLVQMFKTPAH